MATWGYLHGTFRVGTLLYITGVGTSRHFLWKSRDLSVELDHERERGETERHMSSMASMAAVVDTRYCSALP